MSEFQCILRTIDEALKPEEKEEIRRIVYEELEHFMGCLRQSLQDLEKSESIGQLTFKMEKFSSICSLMYDSIMHKIFKKIDLIDLAERLRLRVPYLWRYPLNIVYNSLKTFVIYIFEDAFEKFHEMAIDEAISIAKRIGSKFGLDNIGITVGISTGLTGISFTIQFSLNVEVKSAGSNSD